MIRHVTKGFHSKQLFFESLEDRRMLAAVPISNNSDIVNGSTSSIANLISNHGGDGISLREALIAANNTLGPDQIAFTSGMAGQTIDITGSNLVIGERVTITGFTNNPVIINDNGSAAIGLTFSGFDLSPTGFIGETAVSGIVINGFNTGIRAQNLTSGGFDIDLPLRIENVQIQGAIDGIVLENADIPLVFESNVILGKLSGTGARTGVGIDIENSGQFYDGQNTITGSGAASRIGSLGKGNFIGNFNTGILIQSSFYPDLSISYNQIGSSGQWTNAQNGVYIVHRHSLVPPSLTINVGRIEWNNITYNGGDGIYSGHNDGTVIERNYIGDNGGRGIRLASGADDILIKRNTFDSNGDDDIFLEAGSGIRNRITENDFYGVNVAAGAQPIDLAPNGHTPNDPGDGDAFGVGPNELQNYAEVGTITKAGNIWNVPITLSPYHSHDYILEFYRYDPNTDTFRFIRSETKDVSLSYSATFFFADGTELSDGERIGVVVIDDFGSNKGNTSELSFASLSQLTPNTGGPRVTNVTLFGSTWGRAPISFKNIIAQTGDQLRPIATQNVNTIQIEFSEHVRKQSAGGTPSTIDGSVLTLQRSRRDPTTGSIISDPVSYNDFNYDQVTHIATWTYPDLLDGKYAIHLKAGNAGVAGVIDAGSNFLNAEWNKWYP